MSDILPVLLALSPALPTTTCRQLHRIVLATLAGTGRITQLGLSRWADKGGSYRTIHRFFQMAIDWSAVHWRFFQLYVYREDGVYLLAGDESPVGKSGKQTHGVDWFFSSIHDKVIRGLGFFSIAIIDVKNRRAYSLSTEQIVRSAEEKEQAKQRKEKRKARSQKPGPKRPRGRPVGSKNKNKAEVTLSPELQRILAQAQKVLKLIDKKIRLAYFVLDGHFGNHFACLMVRQLNLHIISKMHHNAELYLQPTPEVKAKRPRLKYGARIDYAHLPEALRCSSTTEDGYRIEVYQACCLHKQFADPINVVILVKTHMETQRVGHVVLFSSDLALSAETLVDYYALRFQIEFTFRDAKQYFGLEDFMGVKKVSVTNAVGLSFFMVNLSRYLLEDLRTSYPDASVNDLKSYHRGLRYMSEILKFVPEKPDAITWKPIVDHICRLGFIHSKRNAERDLEHAA
jgi:putative transposase